MKKIIQFVWILLLITTLPLSNQAQTPNLRSLSSFIIFTTNGAIGNTGSSQITGNVGTGVGAVTGFDPSTNFYGTVSNADLTTTQATTDLTDLCNEINGAVITNTSHLPVYGNGETLLPGVYTVGGAGSVVGVLNLDALCSPNSIFILKFGGAFTTAAASKINLLNGAKACNVFWISVGAISMDPGTVMKGTLIAYPGAVSMGAGGILEGRLLSTRGAMAVNVVNATVASVCVSNLPSSRWLGIDNNWQNINNWCGGVPLINTNILIPSSLNAYPVINTGTANFNNVTIESGASIKVSGTGSCNFYGTITNAGILDITDGTVNLAGSNVTLGGSTVLNGTVKNLYISSGAATSISPGANNMLNVKNNLGFLNSNNTFTTNGNLTLLSTATNTASVTDITKNGAFTGNKILGNAYVERFIPSLKRWRYLAINTDSGIGSKNTVQANWMEGQAPGVNNGGAGKGLWITDAGYTLNPANYDATSFSPSMKWFNGTSYVGIGNPINYDIRSHGAYFTYIRGDRGSTSANGILSTTVLRTFGNLIQGNKSITVTSDISGIGTGNPYASAIDLRKLSYSDTDNVNIFVWDPNLAGGYGQGGFQTLSRSSNSQNFTIIPGGGSYGLLKTMNIIESGLGFFVQGALKSRTIIFNEKAKSLSDHNAFRKTVISQDVYASLFARAPNDSLTMLDAFQVNFASNYNTGLDNNDARKKSGSFESIASIREGTLLAIEYRNSAMSINDSLLINSKNLIAKNYCLSITISFLTKPGRRGVLVDKFLGTETLLNLDSITNYNFTVTSAVESSDLNRFIIIFNQETALGINDVSLTANRTTNGDISLKWIKENEADISYYEMQRSADTNIFVPLGDFIPAGTSAGINAGYTIFDKNPYSGFTYYRLKIIKHNSIITYSNIAKVYNSPNACISVIPNPVINKNLHIYLKDFVAGKYKLRLLNMDGKLIYIKDVIVGALNKQEEILLKKYTPTGNYLLSVDNLRGIKRIISLSIL